MDNKVLDEAVFAALCEWFEDPNGDGLPDGAPGVEDWRRRMRAALLAGVKVLLGEVAEVVGEMTDYIDQEVDPELDVVERWRNQMRSYLNAPSLGEGDGR